MSARVFVHPRYHTGVAVGAFSAGLEATGINMDGLSVSPRDARGRAELVRNRGFTVDGGLLLERLDGTSYIHYPGLAAPLLPPAA